MLLCAQNQKVIATIKKFIATKGKTLYADATPFFQAVHNAGYRSQVRAPAACHLPPAALPHASLFVQ